MQTDRGFVVHRAGGEWDSTLKVSDVIHVTTSRDILAAMARGQGPEEAVVALGYAGWDGGQLEDEIRANAWLSAPVDPGLDFRTAVRVPLGSRRAPAGGGVVAHQPDQRQCLRRPCPTPAQAAARASSWPSISGVGASVSPAAIPSAARPRPSTPCPSIQAGPRWEVIDALLREWQPALAVVGLPYNVDGSDSAMTAAAREFAAELGRRYRLQVALVDERYSSREAEARLKSARESGLRRRRVAKADVDAAAACIILERWFTEET